MIMFKNFKILLTELVFIKVYECYNYTMGRIIFLLGGSGLIGKAITKAFLDNDYEVYNFDKNKTDIINSNYFQLIDSYENIHNYFNKIKYADVIIHLISLSNPYSDGGFENEFKLNFLPTFSLLDYIKNFQKKIYFISSGGTVYGENINKQKFNENSRINPVSNYAKYKVMLEQIMINNKGNNDLKIFRLGNAYGGYENLNSRQGFISIVIKRMLCDEEIVLYNNGNLTRDFIHTADIGDVLFNFTRLSTDEIIFNLSSGIGTKISTLLKMISKKLNKKPKIIHKSEDSLIKYNVLDCSKIRKFIDFNSMIDIEKGVDLTIESYDKKF